MVHESLHTGWGIGRTKWHYSRGVEATGSFECQYILGFHSVSQVPVSITEIIDTKADFPDCSLDDGVNMREGEDILNCDCIDLLVVEDGLVTPILFLDVENQCCVEG